MKHNYSQQSAVITVALLILTCCSESRTADMQPNIKPQPFLLEDAIGNASLIFSGVVEKVEGVGTYTLPISASWGRFGSIKLLPQDRLLRLLRIQVRAEHWIRGRQPAHDVVFYYFCRTSEATDPYRPDLIEPEQRSIFFLRSQNGRIRAWADAISTRLKLVGLNHPDNREFAADLPEDERMARLLLIPPRPEDTHAYSKNFLYGAGASVTLVGLVRTLQLLRPFLTDNDGYVRRNACLALADWPFLGHSDCVSSLPNVATYDGVVVVLNTFAVLDHAKSREQRLREDFSKGPESWFTDVSSLPLRGKDRADVLKFLTFHEDQRIVERVCDAIAKLEPALLTDTACKTK